MPAEAWINVAPLGKQWLVGRAAGHVAAHCHGAQRASVIALPPAGYAKTLRLPALQKILARQLDGGLIGFRATGTEINSTSAAHLFRRQSKQARGKLFRGGGVKLRTVRKGKLRNLLSHSTRYGSNAMPGVYDRSLSCCVQIFFAVRGGNPAAFSRDSNGILLLEIARKQRWMIRHGVRILAE